MSAKKYRLARIAAGLCENCGMRRPRKDCIWCLKCTRTKNLTTIDTRQERKERGLCPRCGRRPPLEDRSACGPCLKKWVKYKKRWDDKQRQNGISSS